MKPRLFIIKCAGYIFAANIAPSPCIMYIVYRIYSQTSIIRGTRAYYIFVSKTADNRGVDNGGLNLVHISWAYQILASKTADNRVPRITEV